MRTLVLISCSLLWLATGPHANADVWISGHGDIGVGFEEGGLHLHIHAEDELGLYGGDTAPAREYESDELTIGVPSPSTPRPAGAEWSFLAPNADDSVWFLPQSSEETKPFVGFATEDLSDAGWGTLTWTFNSITPISGEHSEFAMWQEELGTIDVFASTLDPTAAGNSWEQGTGGHEHFNIGFTGQGVYDVSFSIEAFNNGTDEIAEGNYSDTASFRFATGSAVPEPSSLMLLALASMGGVLYRRRI